MCVVTSMSRQLSVPGALSVISTCGIELKKRILVIRVRFDRHRQVAPAARVASDIGTVR